MADALLVTSSFLPGRGGIESYLAELCDELQPRLAVLAPARRDGRPLPRNLGYRVVAGPAGMLVPGPHVTSAVLRTAAAVGTSRVLFGTPWPLVLIGPSLRRHGLRFSVIVHGAELVVPGAVFGASHRLASALSAADAIFTVSDYTAAQVEEVMGRRHQRVPPLHVLRARVDVERFRPDLEVSAARCRYGINESDKVILSFGRLVARKGVDKLIEALPAIRERVPDALLLIAGTGPEENRLRRLAEDRTVFTGPVPEDLAAQVYALADVFALPVTDRYAGLEVEGLGIVLLEAAACAVPCVTGRSGGTPEAVLDGSTGFVIDATDPVQLVDRIAGLLENPHLARQLGAAGRNHVIQNFYEPTRLQPLLDWLG